MSSLTDIAIKSAVADASAGRGRGRVLSDGEGRGTGRLVLRITKRRGRVASTWFAQQHQDRRKRMVRVGRYPEVSLSEARALYHAHFRAGLASGEPVQSLGSAFRDAQAGTGSLRDLCQTYVDQLRRDGRPSWREARKLLITGSGALCRYLAWDRPASGVLTRDIVAWLGLAYRRGKKALASHQRALAHAAFQFGLASENDYRSLTAERQIRFGLSVNPVHAVAWDDSAYVPRQRHLSPEELAAFWLWLSARRDDRSLSARLMILLGCRVQEITRLRGEQIDRAGMVVRWARTKNGRPHALPLLGDAWEILRSAPESGYLFALGTDTQRRDAVASVCREFTGVHGGDPFQARDLRRTWRTLAGLAGISRDVCAVIQNHAPTTGQVGWRVYDKADRLDEKSAALRAWQDWLTALVGTSSGTGVPTTPAGPVAPATPADYISHDIRHDVPPPPDSSRTASLSVRELL